jgi:stearoyl-CoA desaturase (delta-9 desaturase)
MVQSAETSIASASSPPLAARTIDRVLAFVVTFLPPLALLLGAWLWHRGLLVPGWLELGTMVALQALGIMGVELGYHRLLTHRSYQAKRPLKIALAGLGSLAFQGPVIWWSSIHRKHHRYSDVPGDPHSMYVFDDDGKFTWRGALHAHVGWIWSTRSVGKGGFAEYANDLYRDRDIFWIHMHYAYFMLAGFALPALVSGAIRGTWAGALTGLLWGGFVRIFLGNHLTYWCINSVLHGVGSRPYATKDNSTNLPLLSLFTFGQGWHNNHHACPPAAVMGHHPWELDPGTWLLYLFRKLGWIDRMIFPSAKMIAAHTGAAPSMATAETKVGDAETRAS